MGLIVRIHNIKSPNDFDLKIGLSPYGPFTQLNGPNPNGSWPKATTGVTSSDERNYTTDPIYIGDNDPEVVNGNPPSSDVVFYDLEFDTEYWIRIEDKNTVIDVCTGDNSPRYITENIYIHDSKTFECYDKINFSLDYECITPTPTPTSTPTPTPSPSSTPLPTPTPSSTPLNTPTPSPTTSPTPSPTIVINTETEINIFFDSSGSMNTTLAPLQTMRDTILQNCLLPFYNNDVNLYNQRVTITNRANERAINWISTPPSQSTFNVVNLAFADESNTAYEAANPNITGWTNGSTLGDADIVTLRNALDNATTPTSHRGIIFQVDTLSGNVDRYPQYQAFMNALFNGLGYYAGTAGLSDKGEVSCVQDVIAGSTPQYYADLIVSAMNGLGYNVPSC